MKPKRRGKSARSKRSLPTRWPPARLADYLGSSRFLRCAEQIGERTSEDAVFEVVTRLIARHRNDEGDFLSRFPTELAFRRYVYVAAKRRANRDRAGDSKERQILKRLHGAQRENDIFSQAGMHEYLASFLQNSRLDDATRAAIRMAYHGMTKQEIATSLGISTRRVFELLRHGRAIIRSMLDE
jgi:DNA-directed RNA polymerase specialized sigma24 family protein